MILESIFKLASDNRVALTNTAIAKLDADHQAAQSKLERAPIGLVAKARIKRRLQQKYQERKEKLLEGLAPQTPE
jgi:hypothetical protein